MDTYHGEYQAKRTAIDNARREEKRQYQKDIEEAENRFKEQQKNQEDETTSKSL